MGARTKGFSLVETIVAITVLTVAITGPIYLAYLGIRASRDAKNELVATQLAAEALEAIQARRNSIAATTDVTTNTWMSEMLASPAGTCDTANGCVVDITQKDMPLGIISANAIVECPNAACITTSGSAKDYGRMYYSAASKFYRQGNFTPGGTYQRTPYRRIIRMNYVDANGNPTTTATDQVRVTATVTYERPNGFLGSVSISQDLYNWFPRL